MIGKLPPAPVLIKGDFGLSDQEQKARPLLTELKTPFLPRKPSAPTKALSAAPVEIALAGAADVEEQDRRLVLPEALRTGGATSFSAQINPGDDRAERASLVSARARAGLDDSYKYPLVVLESLESGWEKVVRDLTAPDGGND